jgi:hypothetical protein
MKIISYAIIYVLTLTLSLSSCNNIETEPTLTPTQISTATSTVTINPTETSTSTLTPTKTSTQTSTFTQTPALIQGIDVPIIVGEIEYIMIGAEMIEEIPTDNEPILPKAGNIYLSIIFPGHATSDNFASPDDWISEAKLICGNESFLSLSNWGWKMTPSDIYKMHYRIYYEVPEDLVYKSCIVSIDNNEIKLESFFK